MPREERPAPSASAPESSPNPETLDRAVWAAYGWPEEPAETDDETILRRLLQLNLERSAEEEGSDR